ncbi:MAG: hypothetical protein KAS16_00030 [Thermoplasmata archaeon]|nr:hypothetical protein [Thermoplasmata archaeon]
MSSTWPLYNETIWWKEIIAILALMSASFLALSFLFAFNEPEEGPLLFVIFLGNGILFMFLTYYFRRLDIEIHNEGVRVSWAFRPKEFPWSNIEGVWKDERNALRYGGYGIKGTYMDGKWVLVYNVIMGDRVVIKLKEGKFGEFVFSTRDADQVIRHIEQWINKR